MENKKMQQLSAVQLNTGHGAQGPLLATIINGSILC